MANSNQRNKALAEMAQAVIADDNGIKSELAGLVRDIIMHQRKVMKHGTPAEKAMLVKAVLPQMLSAMGSVAQSEQEAEELAAYRTMLAALRGETPATQVRPSLKAI